jgi:hypothetical protein
MKLSKIQAYLFFLFSLIAICILYQAIWLFSKTTTGEILNFGTGSGRDYKHVENVTIRYRVQNKEYLNTYLRNDLEGTIQRVPIKYLIFAPSISRMDNFIGNWGLVLVVFLIIFSCVSIFFLIQQIVPNGSVFVLSLSYPFFCLKKPAKEPDANDQYAW